MRRLIQFTVGLSILAVCAATMSMLERSRLSDQLQAEETADAGNISTPKPAVSPKTDEATSGMIGRKIAPFVLPDTTGKQVGLADFRDKKIVLIYNMGTGCPIANQYLPDLIEAQKKYGSEWLQVIGINSQMADSAEDVAAHAKEFQVNFPVLCDPRQAAADLLGAERTAEVIVLDPQRVVRYHGRIDDRFSYTTKKGEATREDAKIAITEVLEGKPVTIPVTKADGCLITKRREVKKTEVTYAEHVAPILREKCQDCHHPGTAAPFSLLTYDDAVNWSAMMKEVVLERRMPPWHADPRHGTFENDRSLTQDQIDTLISWADQGVPEGDLSTLPPPKAYPDGWRIGTPDAIFKIPDEVTIQATGEVPYQYFMTPTNFEEDVWIEAAEARPGNRAVVHHIVVFYRAPGGKRGDLEGNWIVGAAPGDTPLEFPKGVGRRIPKGATLIWQLHYTPTGKVEKDQSEIAFRFCKEPPALNSAVKSVKNRRFRIPPGANDYEVRSEVTISQPTQILSFMPHMHLRGKDFAYHATYPDGRREVLLSVPQFDFNWQSTYRPANPIYLPKGTKVECVAHFDNSSGNRANPDPNETVTWGDQTWEEMMIGYVNYVITDEPIPIKKRD